MEQSPEEHASAKLAQHLAMAVQVAESVMRLRQQRIEQRTATDRTATNAARAERTSQHAADRLVWSPALDQDWVRAADLQDLGRAWGAAAGWADTDPTAETAARNVEDELARNAPNAMARYDELRTTGWTRTEAMTDVLADVATEASTRGDRIFVTDPPAATTAAQAEAADAQARADTAGATARADERTPDDLATPLVDEHAEGLQAAVPERREQGAWQADADSAAADVSGAFAHRRVAADGTPHAADVAADSHPAEFTTVTPPATRGLPPAAATTTAARTRSLTR